ncbi:inorganic phosphate transporter, PiT family [Candidatus Methanophagaceae archaeon]|nr:inorganic phosphate transporter, PiT family [Methanophagales archaeon]
MLSFLALLVLIVFLALLYNFLNGANDSANAIATVIATKALTPLKALALASVFNLAGAFVVTAVARTIGKGIVSLPDLEPEIAFMVLIGGLLGAIIWTAICTWLGIPISVTHSLVGGLLGAGLLAGGFEVIQWTVLTNKVFIAIALGPFIGFAAGAFIFIVTNWVLHFFFKKTPTPATERVFKKLQIISSSFMAFSHGMNDTQNAMGVITAALVVGGYIPFFYVLWWVKLMCGSVMALGTFLLGWRVIKTVGWRLAKLEPKHGFSAETGAGLAITGVSLIGMPVSTTHVLASAVVGGTFFQSLRRIRWSEVGRMVTAWVITIPLSAVFGGVVYFVAVRVLIC